MFEQTFVQAQAQTRKPWTVAVSLSAQCLAVAVLFILPLLHTETLRMPDLPPPHVLSVWIDQPPVPPKTSSQTPKAALSVSPVLRPVFLAPSAHASVHSIDLPSTDSESATWSPVGATLASPLGSGTSLPHPEAPIPAIKPETKLVVSGPIRVGGGVEAAKLI